MDFLILHSSEDNASMNIRERFLNSMQYQFQETHLTINNQQLIELKGKRFDLDMENRIYLGLVDVPLIFLEDLSFSNNKFLPDLLIFASRHRSETARPGFLVHSTGNWTADTEFGGKPFQLSKTSALLLKAGFIALAQQFKVSNLNKFVIDLEVTHHGPTALKIPLIFMELGSSDSEWVIKEAGELVSKAIVNAIENYIELRERKTQLVGLGFGGTHYAPNFSRILSNNDIALSFICPKYFILNLNYDMIKNMINNTLEPIDYFIIDWKGTSSDDKKHLIPLLEEFDKPIVKTKDFKSD